MNIPEAIKYPRELSLLGPWPEVHGAHLTFVASEDFRQTAMVVPSPSSSAKAKAVLREEARARRRAFVAGLAADQRELLEASLCGVLEPLMTSAGIVAGYHAIGSEIDPQMAMHWAGNHLTIVALPAFAERESTMIFRVGDYAEAGPYGIPQPPRHASQVAPDLVLVPLLAVDQAGTRLGQGGGHYDRVLAKLRTNGARIIGLGWAIQRVDFALPREPWDVPLDGFASPDGLEWFPA